MVSGCMGFPGGHVRPGEDPEDGLRREVAEELGAELGGLAGGPVLHRIDPQAGLDLTVWVSRRWRGAVGRGQRQKQRARPGAASPDAGDTHSH
ncbi:MAG: NUDIX domain-containing protein [Actinomycetota bacterium]